MLVTPLLLRAAPHIAMRLHRKPNEEAKLEEISALNALYPNRFTNVQ